MISEFWKDMNVIDNIIISLHRHYCNSDGQEAFIEVTGGRKYHLMLLDNMN